MHSSGVCAHLQGSGCASASYLGEPGNTLPEQRFSLPVGAPRAGRKPHRKAESGAPAALPTAVPDGRTDRRADGQTVSALAWGACWGIQSALARRGRDELGQDRAAGAQRRASSRGTAQPASTGPGHSGALLRSSTVGTAVGGKRGPAHPGGTLPPTPLPSLLCPHAPPGCPAWTPLLSVVSVCAAAAAVHHRDVSQWAQLKGQVCPPWPEPHSDLCP